MSQQSIHSMASRDYKKSIIDNLWDILKPKGFKKSGDIFSLPGNDLTYFINVQSGKETSSTILKLTLNIEIYSSVVHKLQDTSLPEKWNRHFTQRIGFLLDNPHDKWWTIENEKEANNAACEILDIIAKKVFPALDTLKSTSDLVTLWRQNKCPGLTEHQRKEYLNLLDNLK